MKLTENQSQNNNNILVLGSGLVSEPCIDYLLKNVDNTVTIGSNNIKEAENLINQLFLHHNGWQIQIQDNSNDIIAANEKFIEKDKERLKFILIDVVKDKDLLYELVNKSDLVISLVPAFFHIYVVRACLDLGKNLLTTSYISNEMKNIQNKVKEKNLIFMYETGVNPGLDHILAHKVIREQEKMGCQIIAYESWVGAIPSPDCIDNPLLYKFSWDPKGALLTLIKDAKQLINGKVTTIPEKSLLTTYLVDKKFHPSLNLEGYYNTDSLKYKELYNLRHAKSVIRGNIRYQGFTFVIQCFKFLNLFSFEPIDEKIITWRDHLNKVLKNPRIQDNIFEVKDKYIKKGGLEIFVYILNISDSLVERMFYFNLSLLALSYFEDKYIRKYGFENLFNRIYSVLIYLELFKGDNVILSKDSVIDALSKLLEKKIIIKKELERDLIFMQNEFQIKKRNGNIINKKYDLIVFGGHNRLPYTATSILVGFPAAIIAQLILDKKIDESGVLIPNNPIIVETVLSELKKFNIHFHETVELKAKF